MTYYLLSRSSSFNPIFVRTTQQSPPALAQAPHRNHPTPEPQAPKQKKKSSTPEPRPSAKRPEKKAISPVQAPKAAPPSHLGRDKVARALLNGNLALERVGHLLSVPLEALLEVVVAVEEVHLAGGLLYLRVQEEHLEEGAGAALAHPYDDGLGQLPARLGEVTGQTGGRHGGRPGRSWDRYQVERLLQLQLVVGVGGGRGGPEAVHGAVVEDVEGEEEGEKGDREEGRGELWPRDPDDQDAVGAGLALGRPHRRARHASAGTQRDKRFAG